MIALWKEVLRRIGVKKSYKTFGWNAECSVKIIVEISINLNKTQELYRLGGRNVWNEFMADPRYRHTFWSILFGGVFGNWGNCWCSHQSMVQRMLACRNKTDMKYSLYVALIFISGIIILSGLTGMVVNKMSFQIGAC